MRADFFLVLISVLGEFRENPGKREKTHCISELDQVLEEAS